jgi:hypothetical protein
MIPSIAAGCVLEDGRAYPTDSFDTQTRSLLMADQDNLEERLAISEVLEDETL